MKITKLAASGIKGCRFDITPAPVTIITGANYSGKSAIKNALELALLGYVPGIGKKNSSIYELSNGEPIGVELHVDGEMAIRRFWKKTTKSITCDSEVNLEVPPVMLELGAIFDLTKAERLKYFFNLANVDFSFETITAAIKAVKVAEPTEATEKAITKVAKLISAVPGDSIQERLQNSVELLRERTKAVSAEVKDHEGFVRTQTRQTDLELQAPVVNARAKVGAARKACDDAREEMSACERAISELKKMQAALSGLQDPVHYNEEDLKAPALESEEIEDNGLLAGMEADIADTQNKIDQVKVLCDPLKLHESQTLANKISVDVGKFKSDFSSLVQRGNELRTKIANAKAERNRDAAMTCCPTCGGDGVSWREKLLAKHDANLSLLAEEFTASKAQYVTTKRDLDAAEQDLLTTSGWAKELSNHQNELNGLHGTLQLMMADRNKLIYSRQKKSEEIRAANERRQAEYEAARQAQVERIARDNAERANLAAKVDAINEDDLGVKYEASQLTLRGCTNALAAADTDLQNETARYSREQERMKSLLRREEVEAELLILKESAKVLLDLQEQSIKSAFEPLLQTARLFTDGILRAPLAFHDGDMGYWRDGAFVPHRTFSGTEEALAYTGLMIALATASNSPLKIAIIDEMARFDPKTTRPAVVDRMIALTRSGDIDHAFLIDPDAGFYTGRAWQDYEDVLIHEVTA